MGIETVQIPTGDNFIKEGDTIPKITMTFSEDIGLTTSTIKMQLYSGGQRVFSVENDNGITAVSDTVLEIDQVSATDNNLPSGVLKGDFEITNASGVRTTYFNIEYTILKQYTI